MATISRDPLGASASRPATRSGSASAAAIWATKAAPFGGRGVASPRLAAIPASNAGLWVASRQARAAGLDAARVTDMAVYVLIAGLVGAKVLLVIVEWNYYARNPRELLSILQSGGVFYGGLLGALPVAWWYARRHALPPWKTSDALAPAVVLGQCIGRLGCFSAGCCYGKPADVPWAVTFRDSYAARTVGTPVRRAASMRAWVSSPVTRSSSSYSNSLPFRA